MQTLVPKSDDIMPDASKLSSAVFKRPRLQEYMNIVITQSFMFEKNDATTEVTFYMHNLGEDHVTTTKHTVTTLDNIISSIKAQINLTNVNEGEYKFHHVDADLHVLNGKICTPKVYTPIWFTSDGRNSTISGLTITRLFGKNDLKVADAENLSIPTSTNI